MNSGKCPHELLIVHGDGVWFRAECAACGLSAEETAPSPAEARAKFNRRRGRQPKRPAPTWITARET